jgi:large subunit ribosomal protein L33
MLYLTRPVIGRISVPRLDEARRWSSRERIMAKKGPRKIVILECTEAPGTSVYTTFKNPRNTPDRLQLKKYNAVLRKHTMHREKK